MCPPEHPLSTALPLRARVSFPFLGTSSRNPTTGNSISDFKVDGANVLLNLNENAYGPALRDTITSTNPFVNPSHLHRYPDRFQTRLKHRFCTFRNSDAHTKQTLTPDNLFLGTGSVEAIDALIRAFCTPGKDSILICPSTYGMYAVSAQVNDVAVLKVPLLSPPTFALNFDAILHTLSITPSIKLLYLASPGNPTGSPLIFKLAITKSSHYRITLVTH